MINLPKFQADLFFYKIDICTQLLSDAVFSKVELKKNFTFQFCQY